MSRTTSIAGVRPLGRLARACAPSAVAWRGRARRSCLARALRGWRESRRWPWERAILMRVSARGQAKGGADGIAPDAQDTGSERSRAPHGGVLQKEVQ